MKSLCIWRVCFHLFLIACLVPSSEALAGGERAYLPRLPGAALLAGYAGWDLALTTPAFVLSLQEREGESPVIPSMSRDGLVIATALVVNDGIPRSRLKVTIATYSFVDKKWREYGEHESFGGAVAISPDGSKLAFALSDDGPGRPVRIHFIDLATGNRTMGPVLGRYTPGFLSWSPDNRQLVLSVNENRAPAGQVPALRSVVLVMDRESGRVRQVAEGVSPAWSPSGLWIAYLDSTVGLDQRDELNRVCLVHPDGTGKKTLTTLGKRRLFGILFPEQRIFRFAPVWSPDSSSLILNEYTNWETFTFDIHILELATLQLRKKLRDKAPVYGWAPLGPLEKALAYE